VDNTGSGPGVFIGSASSKTMIVGLDTDPGSVKAFLDVMCSPVLNAIVIMTMAIIDSMESDSFWTGEKRFIVISFLFVKLKRHTVEGVPYVSS